MTVSRRAKKRPPLSSVTLPPDAAKSVADVVKSTLRERYCLEIPLRYVVVVEGLTDCAYIMYANELCKSECGIDLLSLPGVGSGAITVCTPIDPADDGRKRGGIPWIVRLGEELRQYVLAYEIVGPICFVLDHDPQGEEACKELLDRGYTLERAIAITLDHSSHPGACRLAGKGSDPIVIEDLLSIRVQEEFFANSRAWCDVAYQDGRMVRIGWRNESKAELCAYVCDNGLPDDFTEIVNLIARIRRMWRLGVPQGIIDRFGLTTTE